MELSLTKSVRTAPGMPDRVARCGVAGGGAPQPAPLEGAVAAATSSTLPAAMEPLRERV